MSRLYLHLTYISLLSRALAGLHRRKHFLTHHSIPIPFEIRKHFLTHHSTVWTLCRAAISKFVQTVCANEEISENHLWEKRSRDGSQQEPPLGEARQRWKSARTIFGRGYAEMEASENHLWERLGRDGSQREPSLGEATQRWKPARTISGRGYAEMEVSENHLWERLGRDGSQREPSLGEATQRWKS